MEFDTNGIIEQFFDMIAEKSFDRIINNSDLTEKQAESVKKVFKVFTDNGISSIKALKIIHELGEVLSDYDEKTTVYVCIFAFLFAFLFASIITYCRVLKVNKITI